MIEDKKASALRKVYLENIMEAIDAAVTNGQYRYIEFKVDLENGSVFHSLSVTNGTDIVVVQKDMMRYDKKFKTQFLDPIIDRYSRKGKITVHNVHNHTVDPKPSNTASLKTISDSNNIFCINNAEIDYIESVSKQMTQIQKGIEANVLRFSNPKVSGIINALILAFLVGIFDGTLLMFILKYIIK